MSLEAIRRQMSVTVGDIEGIVAKAVKADVQVVREKFQNCLDVIKKDCDDLKSSCSFLETRKQSLENPDNSATAKDIAELSAKADALSSENRRLTIAVNDLDHQGRRHNIRIQGLKLLNLATIAVQWLNHFSRQS